VTTIASSSPLSRPAGGRHPLGRSPAAAIPPTKEELPSDREPLPAHVLADIAAGFAAARPLWDSTVRHDPDGRRPVRLIGTERYEVWVIGWTTGQNVRVHDHGDSTGAFVVTEGELTEVLPSGSGGVVERTLGSGRLRHLALGTVHDVVNRAVEPATSIHVYSPPLATMTYYDAETLDPVQTEAIDEERALLDDRASSYVLHPSQRTRR
jgi:predicted metal-dependent enzyme (double-stranded beta helix superfamily)